MSMCISLQDMNIILVQSRQASLPPIVLHRMDLPSKDKEELKSQTNKGLIVMNILNRQDHKMRLSLLKGNDPNICLHNHHSHSSSLLIVTWECWDWYLGVPDENSLSSLESWPSWLMSMLLRRNIILNSASLLVMSRVRSVLWLQSVLRTLASWSWQSATVSHSEPELSLAAHREQLTTIDTPALMCHSAWYYNTSVPLSVLCVCVWRQMTLTLPLLLSLSSPSRPALRRSSHYTQHYTLHITQWCRH